MTLIISNLTASPRLYLSGAVVVPASSTVTITSQSQQMSLCGDGAFRFDLMAGNLIQITDGTTTFGRQDALNQLALIMVFIDPTSDGSGNALTSTAISSQRALDVNIAGNTAINASIAGSITGAGQTVTLPLSAGTSSTEIQFTGTFVGTIVFESSLDGGTTYNQRVYRGSGILNLLQTSTTTFPSEWRGNSAGMTHFRVRCTAFTSGSVLATLTSSSGVGAVFLNAAIPIGGASVGNSSTANILTAASFTGTFEDLTQVASIAFSVITSQNTTLRVQYSQDGTTVAKETLYPLTAATIFPLTIPPGGFNFFRLKIDNASGSTSTCSLQTSYAATAEETPRLVLGTTSLLTDDLLVPVNKSVIVGRTTSGGGSYVDIKVNPSGVVNVASDSEGTVGSTAPVIAQLTGGSDGTNLRAFQTDATGNQKVIGSVASGTADSGNPLKIGGVFNTVLPTFLTGQRGDIQIDSSGRIIVAPLTNTSIVKAQLQDNAGTAITLGQKTMTNSVPVVIASDQATFPVSRPSAYTTGTLAALNQAVAITVAEGQSSWDVYLSGTFSATSQVIFEGSLDNTNWFNLNGRRNSDASTNDITTLLDVSPFGGPAPTGANPSNWRGNLSGVRFFRVRCSIYTALDSIAVQISTSSSTGATFINAALPTFADKNGSGTIAALNGTTVATTVGCSSVTFNISGTWVATMIIEGTTDLTNWVGISAMAPSSGGLAFSTFTANTNFVAPCGGYLQIRIRASAYTSGTATIAWNSGAGSNTNLVFNPFPAALNAQVVGNVASAATDSGNPVKTGGVYNSTLTTKTTGQRIDTQSNQFGETAVQYRNKYQRISTNTTTTVKSGSGRLHGIVINDDNQNGTYTIYDNTAGSGTVIGVFRSGSPSGGLLSTTGLRGSNFIGPLGIEFNTGLTIVSAGGTDITVLYQ